MGDGTSPALSSAVYHTATGALNLTVSERLGSYDSARIVLHDSAKLNNVTFSANDFAQHTHGYLNVTLNSTQRASFENLNHPKSVAILPNGMTDLWGNSNTAHLSAAISYSGDAAPPALTSATYDVTAGVLNLTLSERLGSYDSARIVLHDSAKLNNVTFSANDFAQHTHGYLNATLSGAQKISFENLNHPRSVAILPGGVADVWGNQNPAALTLAPSYTNTSPPALNLGRIRCENWRTQPYPIREAGQLRFCQDSIARFCQTQQRDVLGQRLCAAQARLPQRHAERRAKDII